MFPRLRRYFISGLVVFLPLASTVYLFVWVLTFADGLLGKYIEPVFAERFGFYVRGLGILVGVYLIILIGFFVTNFFGRRVHSLFERILLKLPFFRQVYPPFKEIVLVLFSRERMAFREVVLIEYPRKGLYSFGFVTNETAASVCRKTGKDLCSIFIPSAPGPLTGYVIMAPRDEIIPTDMSVEEAIKFIVSGGVVNPQALPSSENGTGD